jgi:NTP pyrophosphatase (non-canonical NTP hydrolase)
VVGERGRQPRQPGGLAAPDPPGRLLLIEEFQRLMADTYGERDRARGRDATVAWLAEELGELARAVRKGTPEEQLHELGDVLAWLASLADQLGLSLADAAARYATGCPRCGGIPCDCP